MIQIYKDRYGNEHAFDTENEICGIPKCKNQVAAITKKNMKYSKMYCEEHTKGVKINCKICNKEMIISCSDYMKVYPNIPRCKQCQLNELNKSPKMRKQARDLGKKLFIENKGMFSKESKELAIKNSHTKEVCKIREENKRNNGFYDKNGGYEKGLNKRKENGSLEKWQKSGQTKEAHAKQNITKWKNMSEENKEKEIKRLNEIGFTPNFITKNHIRFYKSIEVHEFSEKILSGKLDINDYPNINIRFGKVCYGTEDILTSEKLLKIYQFEEKDNVLYYYDKTSKTYIPWEKYKLKFSRMRTTSEINNFIKKLKALEIFQPKHMGPVGSYDLNDIIQLLPTFRTQDSQDWTGAKNAFEQSLVDADIHWFTYIKFYIDNKKKTIRPLVVGKSGSLLVNSSGSDLSFSTDINDGPARKFLNDENLQWDKTQILIIKAKSEQQALFYEWKIAYVYELFES